MFVTKPLLRERALTLRKEGYSYSYIAEQTGVSKGTLSAWLASVPYSPNTETLKQLGKARSAATLSKHKQKIESLESAHQLARKDIGKLNERDIFMLGIGLYIGEGMKDHNSLRVINGDPRVICLAIKWLKSACGLDNSNFKLRLHIYPDTSVQEAIAYWSEKTGLPSERFHKCQIDMRTNKKSMKKGKLPFGTAHLSILANGKKEHGVFLARRVNGWLNEVLRSNAGLI